MEGGDFIKVTGLCKRFSKKKKPALDAIDLCFPKGKRIGIVGPDGAGKTTFLRILAWLLLPSSGSVDVGGLDLSKETSKVQKMIGYMPQKFGLY